MILKIRINENLGQACTSKRICHLKKQTVQPKTRKIATQALTPEWKQTHAQTTKLMDTALVKDSDWI